MVDRLVKVGDLISRHVSEIIKDEADLEVGALVTVVRTVISPTFEHAIIWISIFPTEKGEKVLLELNNKIFHIQQSLNKKLVMRKVPKIIFKIDKTEEQAGRVENIIDNLKES